MSKLEILQRTINYIKDLKEALDEPSPPSPSKLAAADIPKKPRMKRTKPSELLPTIKNDNKLTSQSPNFRIDESDGEPCQSPVSERIDIDLNQRQVLPWQTQVEIVSLENQENLRSCRYTDSNVYYPQNQMMPFESCNYIVSPVSSHSSTYSSSTQNSSTENQWCIDFSEAVHQDTKATYTNYCENAINQWPWGDNY